MREPHIRHPRAFLLCFGLALSALVGLSSCGDGGPTGLDTTDLELVIVQGNGQASEPGGVLPVPLMVRVQRSGNGAPIFGAKVRWKILGGAGAAVEPPTSETDSLGLAQATLRLGSEIGMYGAEASITGVGSKAVEFAAEAILAPDLSAAPPGPVQGGDTILLTGSNFSTVPGQNLVTFSRLRGRVVTASPTELRVVVPGCLLQREYQVRVQVGAVATDPVSLEVTGGPASLLLQRGEDRVIDASEAFGCFHLPSGPGSLYLVMPHSTSTVGGGFHEYSLVGLTGDGVDPPLPSGQGVPANLARAAGSGDPEVFPTSAFEESLEARDRWHEHLRLKEAALWAETGSRSLNSVSAAPPRPSPQRLPELGEKRVFKVLNTKDRFDRVTARLRHVTGHSLIYVDEASPEGGFKEEDLAALALEFEDPIYPTVTGLFGAESDLDGNDRVIILLTPGVNRLTPPGSDGYVGGFFYGLDLLSGRSGSNEAEIFYAMVPDPAGDEGPVISRLTALNTIPAVLAHEFEHMVHFNQRMLVGGAETTEALWLSEALAQMAEDLVGEAFENTSQYIKARQYRAGNWHRAVRFLENPGEVSVLASLPPGTLAERGAGWLFLKQIYGRVEPENILRVLVRSTSSGTGNVSQAMEMAWEGMVADWAGSIYLDGTRVPVRPDLQVAGVDLRVTLSEGIGAYPLHVRPFGERSGAHSGALWPSAPDYFIVEPDGGGGIAIGAGGPGGGLPEGPLGLQVLVVRLL